MLNKFQEKRKYIRLDTSVHITVLPYEVTEENILLGDQKSKRSQNLCAGGILFKYNTGLPKGSLVKLQLFLPSEVSPMEIIGEIRHITNVQDNLYEIGVAFLKISDNDKNKLISLKQIA